uniref:C2H2-type domain-containing protein n=1 Tax=Cuerna arida TaxID=1464854 RepID=A0A1B6GVQ2_9HEMI
MTEYLTSFANTLDDFFKGLSDCGLMTSYTVQLQSNVASVETMLKFRTIIQELIKNLQSLLSSIPSVQSAEASTQTLEDTTEVVVTCHPISLATLTSAQILPAPRKDVSNVCDDEEPKEGCIPLRNCRVTSVSKPDTPPVMSSIEICQLKPLLIETNENFSELVNIQSQNNRKDDKIKVENIVHIVVEASNNNSNFEGASDTNIVKFEQLQCLECDIQFKSREELKDHLQSRHSLQQHMQICNMCDKIFSCLQSLQEHCRREHDGAGCFMCTTCNKRFMTKLSFTRHLDTHKGKKEAICDLCGKAFSRADYLQTHYSIHLGKRNYACSQCPRKFVRSIHLRAHEKIHSGVKDHVCKVCNKGFVRSDKLKEHMLRHLNIKRFQCPVCQRDYAEKRDLKVHLKSHSK